MATSPKTNPERSLTRAQFMRHLSILLGPEAVCEPQQGGNDDHLTVKLLTRCGGATNFVFNEKTACLEIWRGRTTLSLAIDTRRRGNMIRFHMRDDPRAT